MSKPEAWLTETDEVKASTMRAAVEKQWLKGAEPGEYTPHDLKHFARVEQWIQALIPQEKWHRLAPEERKILTWCAWTHDIGMFTCHYPPSTRSSTIRKQHVEQSALWVADQWAALELGRMEAQIVADTIRFHSRSNPLRDCPEHRACGRTVVRPRLLAAYLRLADALDVAQDRVEEPHRFNLLIRQISEEIDDTLFHWIKSFVVSGIAVDHRRHEIKVDFIQYSGPNQRNFTVIKRYVLNEIEDELASVEKTLAFGGVSSFHLVTSTAEVTLVGDYQDKLKGSVERVLGWAQLTQSPNSTAITVAALGALQALIDQTIETRKKEPGEALETLRSGLQRLIQSLRHQLRTRCCHNELHLIFEFLNSTYEAIQFKEELDEGLVGRLGVFAQRFMSLVRPDLDRHIRLAEDLADTLQKLNSTHVATEPWTFLLYGCSDSVATVLASFAKGRRLRLCIAEGRPKTHHGARNVPTYVDAEAYVERLHSLGIKPEVMSIIPDATIASTMDVGKKALLPQFDAVILGANGIYIEPEMMVAHSAGHLMCAICAKEFGIPVIVLGASTKLSRRPERSEGKALRHSQWFSSDEGQRERIKEYGANTEWNLREDRIPLNLVDALITDRGTIFPKKSVDLAKKELSRQMDELDRFLETQGCNSSVEAVSPMRAREGQAGRGVAAG